MPAEAAYHTYKRKRTAVIIHETPNLARVWQDNRMATLALYSGNHCMPSGYPSHPQPNRIDLICAVPRIQRSPAQVLLFKTRNFPEWSPIWADAAPAKYFDRHLLSQAINHYDLRVCPQVAVGLYRDRTWTALCHAAILGEGFDLPSWKERLSGAEVQLFSALALVLLKPKLITVYCRYACLRILSAIET